MDDPYDLQRFVDAQDGVFGQARDELSAGRKTTHWMWFVFPQLRGLGHSAMATTFGITSLDEARAYLAHPLLGPRLRECVALTLRIRGRSVTDVFGSPDDLKFRSCMTLFQRAGPEEHLFGDALRNYCGGTPDTRTLELLHQQAR
ncbi:MAG: calpastatin [Xanthomonadaceae bacterium]|nr:calpastatin [Xanthomonadaceae bacterium]